MPHPFFHKARECAAVKWNFKRFNRANLTTKITKILTFFAKTGIMLSTKLGNNDLVLRM